MKVSILATTFLTMWSASASVVNLYPDDGCNGPVGRGAVLAQDTCLNKFSGFWLSYKLTDRAGKEPEQYIRTWRKKNCHLGNGEGNFQTCRHVGPDGGMEKGTCVSTMGFKSISQSAAKCP
jgi:hypothetical protein